MTGEEAWRRFRHWTAETVRQTRSRWQDVHRRRRFLAASAVLLTAVCAAGYAFQSRWLIGIDPQETLCLQHRIYLIDTKDRTPAVGGIYLFLSEGAAPVYPDGTRLAKRLAAAAGDTVEITESFDVMVNGERIASGLWHLRGQDPALVREKFTGRRVLREDEYWMTGDSPRSFDSRYFGPIHADRIIGRAYGIF